MGFPRLSLPDEVEERSLLCEGDGDGLTVDLTVLAMMCAPQRVIL